MSVEAALMFYSDWMDANPITFWLIFVAALTFAAVIAGAVIQWHIDGREYRAWRGGGYKRYRPR